MNKYTVRIGLPTEGTDIKEVKTSIENVFLRAHTPTLLRFGESRTDNGDLLIEIASDAKRDRLSALLQKLDQDTKLRIKELGWGWIISESLHQSRPMKPLTFEDDPYSNVSAQESPQKEYHCSLMFTIKLFSSLAIIGLFVLYVILFWVYEPLRLYQVQNSRYLSVLFLILWIALTTMGLSLFPLIPWRYASTVQCGPESLTIKYFLKPSSMSLLWNEMIALNISYNSLTLHTKSCRIKVMMGPDWCKAEEQAAMIKTILTRARLNHVAGGVHGSVYKRFDTA